MQRFYQLWKWIGLLFCCNLQAPAKQGFWRSLNSLWGCFCQTVVHDVTVKYQWKRLPCTFWGEDDKLCKHEKCNACIVGKPSSGLGHTLRKRIAFIILNCTCLHDFYGRCVEREDGSVQRIHQSVFLLRAKHLQRWLVKLPCNDSQYVHFIGWVIYTKSVHCLCLCCTFVQQSYLTMTRPINEDNVTPVQAINLMCHTEVFCEYLFKM